ncbi:MAG: hypothetical protein PHI39_04155 [Kiritimatiellae bacterium]|nr:hypothetical protein [Kiritimatiellia bacterium]
MKKWIFLILLCAIIGGFLAYYHNPAALESFRAAFLTITFAVATFSVMFSMGGFNSSAYRQFHRAIPPRLLWSCVALLFIALLPLGVLVLKPDLYIHTCLLLLPVLAVAGSGLIEIARRETDPITLLDRLCTINAISRYLRSLVPLLDVRIAETKALELSKTQDCPMHEFAWHLPMPSQNSDPLNCLATLGLLTIQHGDLHAFGRVVSRSLEALDLAENFQPSKTTAGDYTIRRELRGDVFDAIQRMMLALQRDKGTVSLARKAIDSMAESVVAKTKEQKQTQDLAFAALHLMEILAQHCYESGSHAEILVPLIVSRQVVQKGMDDPPKVKAGEQQPIEISMFNHTLPQLTGPIKHLGSFAIEKGDSDFLYRCFDAFGWLGCSAVKHQKMLVATACLRALSQLGREVKAKGLECHWDKCAVRPEDHAAERIDWIATWVSKVPEDGREYWIGLLEAAYSRLSGRETSLKFETDADGKTSISKNISGKKHVESYFMHAASREVDYSDFSFLKDLELHGGKGVYMRGPPMPLVSATTEKT